MGQWDSRGGVREGAGRPKNEIEKKAFRVTPDEKLYVQKMRRLTEQGQLLLKQDSESIFKNHTRLFG